VSGPSFTRGEYWILESAVEGMPPMNRLVSPDIEGFFNKTGHGLPRGPLLDTLQRLADKRFICLSSEARGEFAPTRAEVAAALDEPRDERLNERTHYGLTPAGGAAWEAFAAPDWNRFITASSDVEEDERGFLTWEVVAASPDWLRRYLDAVRTESRIDEASIVRDEVRPWEATYWKTLDVGYRVQLKVADGPPEWRVPSYVVADSWCRWR
jgi:hypothetical protein